MPKRGWAQIGGRTYKKGGFTSYRRTGGAFAGGARRGRFAGRYRKSGFYGRYPGAGGPVTGGELKFHDIDWDQAAADWTAGKISNTSSLILIGQGVTESTRIGRKAVIRSIGWRGQLELIAQSTVGLPNSVRVMLIQDKQCNGAAPLVATTAGVLASANYQSFNNLANKGRFKVLMDKTYAMNVIGSAGDGTSNDAAAVERNFTFFKKCNIPIEYSGTASPAVITEVRTNNIFGLLIAGDAGANIKLDSKFRFRFADG